jgi:hypothetical protein
MSALEPEIVEYPSYIEVTLILVLSRLWGPRPYPEWRVTKGIGATVSDRAYAACN